MGIKGKFGKAWKRVASLEDDDATSEQDQVAGNERIPYKEISKKLKALMKQNVDVVGRKILIPNFYTIFFNEIDRKLRIEVEDVIINELREEIYHEMRKINPEQSKQVIIIEFKTDESLDKGEFKITHHTKKEGDPVPVQSPPIKQPPAPATPVQPEMADDDDFRPTVIEEDEDTVLPEDEQKTIVQMPQPDTKYTLIVESENHKEEIPLIKETTTIGRSSKDDIVLQSADFSISRSHAVINLRDNAVFLLPTGINGTMLNGEELELQKEVQISPGDELKIIDYALMIIPN
ncbi:MAG: DUF2662 domain-containing protein [Calditrichaeota bacterium]|nr:MAG: DUF2662 domain-containing protein [Calditrichota bacterium]